MVSRTHRIAAGLFSTALAAATRVRSGARAAHEHRQGQRRDRRTEGAPHGPDGRPVIRQPTRVDAQS